MVMGPSCGLVLADLGAEVIKVEPLEGDNTRRLAAAGAGFFPIFNRNKVSLPVDLKKAGGLELVGRLIARADVVTENFRPGALDRMGLGYETLKAVKPDIILVTLNAYGLTGEWSKYRTYGVVLEPMCGFFSLTGYLDDESPIRSGVDHIDPLSGAHGAGAALAALLYRQKTGKGQHVNLSFLESAANFIGVELLEYGFNKRIQGHMGNRDRAMAPHGCYRCQGDDKWVTIAVGSDAEWASLCRVMRHPAWTKKPEFQTQVDRLHNQDELDKHIESWTKQRDKFEVMELLQKAGIAAGAVLDVGELMENPHMRSREFFATVHHPDTGDFEMIGPRAKLSRTPGAVRAPAPKYGEHNDYVFHQLLGLSQKAIDDYVKKGIICNKPR